MSPPGLSVPSLPLHRETEEERQKAKHDQLLRSLEYGHAKAEAGVASSQVDEGLTWLYGIERTADPVEAARWFRKAAEQGDIQRQFFLGRAYARGEGVPQDREAANRWIGSAAAKGMKIAPQEIEELRMLGVQF